VFCVTIAVPWAPSLQAGEAEICGTLAAHVLEAPYVIDDDMAVDACPPLEHLHPILALIGDPFLQREAWRTSRGFKQVFEAHTDRLRATGERQFAQKKGFGVPSWRQASQVRTL